MILLYHHIAPAGDVPASESPDEGWVFRHSPEGLERQLVELRRRGFEFVSLPDLVARIRESGSAPAKLASITLDDGWKNNHEHALPIFVKLGVRATFFLTTEHLRGDREDPRKMSRSQIRELLSAGMSLGGHSRTHADLTRVAESQARTEIAGSKADLEEAFGQPVRVFAYPGGAFNRRVVELTREAGYEAACSVLSPVRNDRSSLYWMFRDRITEEMNTFGDRYRLSALARRLLEWRVRRRLQAQLRGA